MTFHAPRGKRTGYLQQFVSRHGAKWSMLMAASTVMTLPIVILFFFAQNRIRWAMAPGWISKQEPIPVTSIVSST